MTYDGKLYALPMQAQMYIMAYRKDVFDQVGLQPPKTFEEMKTAAKTIQEKAGIKYPIALPWLATGDIVTSYDCILGSLGTNLTNFDTKTANFDKPQAKQALDEMIARAVHGPAGDDLRPAGRPAADVQRHRRDRHHVLRGVRTTSPSRRTASTPSLRVRRAAEGGD